MHQLAVRRKQGVDSKGGLHRRDDRRIASVHAARQRAKGGEDQPVTAAGSLAFYRAGPCDSPPFGADCQPRMEMTGNLRRFLTLPGFVAQLDPADCQFVHRLASNHPAILPAKSGIVIASDPDPVGRTSQRGKHSGGVWFEPVSRAVIVKVIAQRIDSPRAGFANRQCQPFQCFAAVIGRQHLPRLCKEACLFEVEISHQQRIFARPIERATACQLHFLTRERKGNHSFPLPYGSVLGKCDGMTDWTPYTERACDWFTSLRDSICAEFESIEREAGSNASFEYTDWQRDAGEGESAGETGGGTRGLIKGEVFEKAGVNISTVHGAFSREFAASINGASPEAPQFSATGISLVAHMANPHVPAVHMNTRFLTTTKAWFGGGADLNPPIPYDEDTADFHAAFKAACDAHESGDYPRFKEWADDYFYIPHRQCHRGVGGIFYDHMECADEAAWEANFAFTKAVGEAFLHVFPRLVRRRMGEDFTDEDKQEQLEWRGRYAEFNLVYDRGTAFGLKTGGNTDAILMSLPPEVKWT